MKFMVILKGERFCEPRSVSRSLEMARYNRALIEAGVLVAAEELHPSARGARVEGSNGKPAVVHGAFAEPGGVTAGFWILNVASLGDAIEWGKRCPLVQRADAKLVIRQLYDFGDFDAAATPSLDERREPLVAA